jgi:sugar O-acyltransferase (sialic acid O-acetyltransferase NeuD family)
MRVNKQSFLIWGAKGHAKVLDEIIRLNNGEVIALVDRDSSLSCPIDNLKILNGYQGYIDWVREIKSQNTKLKISAIAAIGGDKGKDRLDYLKMFKRDGLETPSLIHPKSHISDTAVIGENSQICAFAVIGANASIGDACIVNTKASVDHESTLGNGVHLAPGATLCGCVKVGNYAFVGAGAIILPNVTLGENSFVGAGSVVTRDVPENVLVYGNPAKIIRKVQNA